MSDRVRQAGDPSLPIRDMERFCGRILDCTAGLDQATFVSTGVVYESSMWNLSLIGEAASNVPRTVREAHPEIPWSLITGARNQFLHRYWRIDNDIVWDIVQTHVPYLLDALRNVLRTIDEEHA